MTASEGSTAPSSAAAEPAGAPDGATASDMAWLDAHEVGPREYEEAPDLADRHLTEGVLEVAGVPRRRGRPFKEDRKLLVSLRLDPDVLAHFKAGGQGWQGRINDFLRAALGRG